MEFQISDALFGMLEDRGASKLIVNCDTGEKRKRVLEILSEHGCDIHHGRNRIDYITDPVESNPEYPSPEFSISGKVSCMGSKHYADGIDYDDFIEEIEERMIKCEPFPAPPT